MGREYCHPHAGLTADERTPRRQGRGVLSRYVGQSPPLPKNRHANVTNVDVRAELRAMARMSDDTETPFVVPLVVAVESYPTDVHRPALSREGGLH